MEKGETSMEVVFSTDGQVIKEKVEEQDNDEEND